MSAVHATTLDLSISGLALPNGLRITLVELKLPTPVVQISPIYLQEGTVADVNIIVDAADLEAYLNRRQPSGLSGFQVSVADGLLTVKARATVILPVEVGAQGTLQFSDGKLDFMPTRAEIGGVKMPEGMMTDFLKKANPLIDARGYPVDVNLKTISLENGKICLAGRVTLTASMPRREP